MVFQQYKVFYLNNNGTIDLTIAPKILNFDLVFEKDIFIEKNMKFNHIKR